MNIGAFGTMEGVLALNCLQYIISTPNPFLPLPCKCSLAGIQLQKKKKKSLSSEMVEDERGLAGSFRDSKMPVLTAGGEKMPTPAERGTGEVGLSVAICMCKAASPLLPAHGVPSNLSRQTCRSTCSHHWHSRRNKMGVGGRGSDIAGG